CHNYSDSPYSF
nr:immunoglobulin light chain junction region [Macaca mulatta]MOW39134.1 immunoglobulin light chain junction region [Macaca mulatta]MOW39338.1 immunoglobulin light chain junction region [Macaca mulatta]MOW39351.1 immunoglobulin light chain junction region [Macaca mulatta]MOW39512.1 immunoglobulin light chain junction region [Macaca mulatta]